MPTSPLSTENVGSGLALHPLLIHFPIALLLTGSGALLWALLLQWRNSDPTSPSSFINNLDVFAIGALLLGYAGLIGAIGAGLADLLGSPKAQARDGWVIIAVIHLSTGFSLLIIYGILLFRRLFGYVPAPTEISIAAKFDWFSTAIVILGIILTVVTGWFGGELVYSYRVGIS